MTLSFWLLLVGIPLLSLLVTGFLGTFFAVRWIRAFLFSLLNRPISDTLSELYVSLLSTPPLQLLYVSLRAGSGDVVIRPMGSPKPRPGFDALSFVPAQLKRRPVDEESPVSLEVTLGERARRPLKLQIPMFVSGMAFGLAVSKEARLALAEGCQLMGTALNSGQGPFFQEERERAGLYILQFGRWNWNRREEILKAADMIEIQVGQGAMPGNAVISTPQSVSREILDLMGLAKDEPPTIHANLFLERPGDGATLKDVADYLRHVVPDIPLAVKFGAGDDLEGDIDVALEAGVDVIVVDGTEGATGNAPITLSDHFGLPSLVALSRARRHLERSGRQDVDLVISGGFREPGDIMKAVALGAKAVGLGSAAMFAIAHPRLSSALPFRPPTDLVFYHSARHLPLEPHEAAKALANFLSSSTKEMAIALKALGHTRLLDLSPRDLCTLSKDVAEWTGVRYAGRGPASGKPIDPALALGEG